MWQDLIFFPLLCTCRSYCTESKIPVWPQDKVYIHYLSGASGRRISTPGDGSLFCIQSNMIVKQSDSFFIERTTYLVTIRRGWCHSKKFFLYDPGLWIQTVEQYCLRRENHKDGCASVFDCDCDQSRCLPDQTILHVVILMMRKAKRWIFNLLLYSSFPVALSQCVSPQERTGLHIMNVQDVHIHNMLRFQKRTLPKTAALHVTGREEQKPTDSCLDYNIRTENSV